MDIFDDYFSSRPTKKVNGLTPRKLKIQVKIKTANKLKSKVVADLVTELPEKGEALHVISSGSFDYFTLVPHRTVRNHEFEKII